MVVAKVRGQIEDEAAALHQKTRIKEVNDESALIKQLDLE